MPTAAPGESFAASRYNALGITAQFEATANGATLTVDTVTDMVLNNVPVIAGDTYAIHLNTRISLTAGGGVWVLEARVNGTKIGEFGWVQVNAQDVVDGTVYWDAPVTQATDDFDVFANEITVGSDLVLVGAAGVPRTLTITNVSAL
jgi:hypothetical protein